MFKKKRKINAFTCVNHLIFIILSFVSLFPVWLIIANAFSSEADIQQFGYAVYPLHASVEAFRYIFKEPSQLLYSTFATVVYSFGQTFFSVLIQALLGYALSRKEFVLKKFINVLLLITMFFNAGLIPTYMVRTQLYHLENSWLVYLVPAVSGFSVFLFRSFFQQVPQSIVESAEIDGASQMQLFLRISVPLTKVLFATQFFLGVRGLWTDFTTSMYYISDSRMYTLEYYIQLISKDAEVMKQNLLIMGMKASEIPTETMKFALVLLTVIPMLLIFPFFQKFFSKGLTVGAVKG